MIAKLTDKHIFLGDIIAKDICNSYIEKIKKHTNKLKMQLTAIDTAFVINDLNLPNYRLHSLKGNKSGLWSITVNGNWRITFGFLDGNAYILNYEDYH